MDDPEEKDPFEVARAAVRQLPGLTSVPHVAARASEVAQDPESSVEDLARAFSGNPALCSHLLEVANSAYYGLRAEVVSVERAAVVLGRNFLRNIALAASIRGIVHKAPGARNATVEGLWRHAVRSAGAASFLAAEDGLVDVNDAFAAGLLHDLGLLVELETDRELLGDVDALRQRGACRSDVLRVERERFGADHSHFGAALCEAWRFPQALVQAIRYHHDPGGAPEEHRTLAAVIHVAEVLGSGSEHGVELGRAGAPELPDPGALELLGLADEDLDELRERLGAVVDDAESALG